ncbi:MAG: outer membrane protein assembly factor BamA [Thermodesulfovibrionales bacterium]|nr:outer membrane protein assembly factor BamA [Thermodesulfovibrionales bacterium]
MSFAAPAAALDIPVLEVQVEGLHSIDKEELIYLLGLREGGVIDRASLRRGIKRAFLKGIFEDISVEAAPVGVITVRVREKDFIDNISVKGNLLVPGRFIKANFALKEDQPMRYELADESVARLKAALVEKGFSDAAVELGVRREDEPYRVDLILRVTEGKPLVVDKIQVLGRPSGEVGQLMTLREGDVYDQFKLREDIERLRKFYVKSGYIHPAVGPYTFRDGELDLSITAGKRLDIKISGNRAISAKALMSALPFFEAGDFSDELLEEATSKLMSLYRAKGYPFVQIAPVASQQEDEIRLSLFIKEGIRVNVGSINLEGVTIGERKLKEMMSLKEGGLFSYDLIDSDVSSVREFYTALGYLNVSVAAPVTDIKDSRANITIKITEGAIVNISEFVIKGLKYFSEPELMKAANLKAGSPYNEVDLADARYRILDFYGGRGFADCRVDILRELHEEGVKVVFSIEEGGRTFFGHTIVGGNLRTNRKVIERELSYSEGAPLDYAMLAMTKQRLYKLGLFTHVSAEAVGRHEDRADVAIKVEEGKAGSVDIGLGYGEYERQRGALDINYRNLWGMNRQAGIRTEVSSIENRQILNYHDPWFSGRRIPLRAYLIREERREKNIDTDETRYRLRRYSASVGTEKKPGKAARVDMFYEFSLVKTFDVASDVILSKEDTGTLAISSLRPGIVYDTRDNAFDPKRGIFAGMSLKASSSYLFSETDFLKLIVHGNSYNRLLRRLVAAVSLKAGVAKGYRDTAELPIIERFFLGGRSTVRGYPQDGLGPKGGRGTPVGGDAFMLGNLELRTYLGKSWIIVAFLDGGNVWPKINDMDVTKLKYTTGGGLRYNTPVGPIRLDYGYKLNRELGESAYELHFSIGHAF